MTRVDTKFEPWCVWGECDFHLNWLHVSLKRPTHWRLNDDFDINQRRHRLTPNIQGGAKNGATISLQIFKFHRTVAPPSENTATVVYSHCTNRFEHHIVPVLSLGGATAQ